MSASQQGAADGEPSLARPPEPPNSFQKRVRRFLVALRSLKAELLAFPVRIRRIDSNLIALADLPGLKKEEIRVELTDNVLVIEAEPNREDEAFFRRAGRRIIALPDDAEIHFAKAELKNGLLTVSLPLSSSRKRRTIPVEEVVDIELQQPNGPAPARNSASPAPHEEYAAV